MKKQIVQVAQLFKFTNTVYPPFDATLFDKDVISWHNGEIFCSIPFKTGVRIGIDNTLFLKSMAAFENPTYSEKRLKLTISEGSKNLSLAGIEPDNFAAPFKGTVTPIGKLGQREVDLLQTSLPFISKNDLHPAMTFAQVHTHIAATDTHRLFFPKLETPLKQEVLLHPKTIRILSVFGGDWAVEIIKEKPELPGAFVLHNTEGVKIMQRNPYVRFPDWKVVVPKMDKDTPTAHFDKKEMLRIMKDGAPFANKCTNQMIVTLAKKSTVVFNDVDFSTEYSSEITVEHDPRHDIQIGFNLKFLSEIFALCPDKIKVRYFSPVKCWIIEDRFLLMPLMLNV